MEQTCARAVELGLPAIAFTEHLDLTPWSLDPQEELPVGHFMEGHRDASGRVTAPPFDPTGYLEAIERCRELFPSLRICTGLEVSEPHRHADVINRVLSAGGFDRILGSVHLLPERDGFREPAQLFDRYPRGEALRRFDRYPRADVLRRYLAEIVTMVNQSDTFSVLAHIDYPLRHWNQMLGHLPRHDIAEFEEEFREALRAAADTGRILEINTRIPLEATILRWWHDEGGSAVTFGSDAHEPNHLARNFDSAAELAKSHGFRPAQDPLDPWPRAS